MAKLYKITPLEKKSIDYRVDVYENLPDGTTRGWNVVESYRWGVGYREEDDPVYEYEKDSVRCDPSVGPGADLDDGVATWFDYDESYTEEEIVKIEESWYNGDEEGRSGAGWIFDGEHQWQVEDDTIEIAGPFRIDLIDEDTGEVLHENVQPLPPPSADDHDHKEDV